MSCISIKQISNPTKEFTVGLYTPYRPGFFEARKLKKEHKSHFGKPYILAFDFKKDSTYMLVNCNRKASHKGKWKIEGDSIHLYNRINKDSIRIKDLKVLFKDGMVFYTNPNSKTGKGYNTWTSLYKINSNYLFDGRINEEKPQQNSFTN